MEQNRNDIIDNYLLNTMPDNERKEFEQQLSHDSELGKEVAVQKEIIYAVQERAARENTTTIRNRVRTKRMLIRTFSITPIAVAASIIAAIMIIDLNKINSLNNNQQFIAYLDYSCDEIRNSYDTMRGCTEVADAILSATEAIKNQEYKNADFIIEKALLEQQTDFDPNSKQQVEERDDMIYLQAISAIKQNKPRRAKKLLRQLIDTRYDEQAKYMLEQLE